MAKFIMVGPLQAIGFILLFAILSVFLPLMSLLSNAAIGLITLRMGWQRGLMIATVSSAVLAGLSLITQADPLMGFVLSMMVWLPVIALAALLGNTVSWSRTLSVLLGIAVVGILLFHLNVGDPVKFWQAQPAWQEFVVLADTMKVFPADLPAEDKQQILDSIPTLLAGGIAAIASILLILSLLLARHWQAMLYNPGGFSEEWRQMNVGKIPALLMVGVIGLAIMGKQPTAIDVVFAGLAIFVFQGLALVHSVVGSLQQHKGWLVGMYVLLFLMPVQVGILLAAFGIIDGLADFRSQIKARKS